MFTQQEIIGLYSAGTLSITVAMALTRIKTTREFVRAVKRCNLPFPVFIPDARSMLHEEKQEFFKRYVSNNIASQND